MRASRVELEGGVLTTEHLKPGLRSLARDPTVLLTGLSLVLCTGIFLWASARGFEITDEAAHLIWAESPFSFRMSLTQYGYVWHPLYALVGGDVALFRIAGLVVLIGCAALFATSLTKLLSFSAGRRDDGVVVTIAVLVSVYWQFQQWSPSPDYDQLDLCAVLLFFAGLMAIPLSVDARDATRYPLGGAALAGIALGLLAITKSTSFVATAALGLMWIALSTRRPPVAVAVLSAFTLLTVAAAIVAIDGSLAAYIQRNVDAYQYMRSRDVGFDVHGIAGSIAHPFSPAVASRAVPALAVGVLEFVLAVAVLNSTRAPTTPVAWQRAVQVARLVLFGVLIAVARAADIQQPIGWSGARSWHFPLLLTLCAVAATVLVHAPEARKSLKWQLVLAAAFLAVAPFVYSIGTNNTLIFHMSGAGIFWTASALALSAASQVPDRRHLIRATALLCCVATLGMLAAVAWAPGRIGAPLWRQTDAVPVGPASSTLYVDPRTATYLRTLESGAVRSGFTRGTPMIELSAVGPGIVYALSGRPLGVPWLLSDGPNAVASSRLALSHIAPTELRRAWIVTGKADRFAQAEQVLHALGIPFPAGYDEVVTARHPAFGWVQTVWKPHVAGPAPQP